MTSGRYRAYPDYKESGEEWLGAVPRHWKVIQIKHLSPVKRGASPRPIDAARYFDDNGEYAWTRIADVTASDVYLTTAPQRLSKLGSSLSVKLNPGELFLSIAGSVGKPCITGIKACIHDGFVYFPELNIPSKFLFYVFAGEQAYKGLGKFGTQLNLNTDTVGGIKIGCAALEEIKHIVKFLDHETAKIDRLIEKQEELIRLLKEKRQAVISHAVTKGLNPHAPLKDSGIPWLGQVPAHWIVAGFKKYLSSIVDYRGKTPDKVDAGVFLVTARNIKNGKIDYEAAQEFIRKSDYETVMSRGKPRIGEILFTTEAPLGEVATVDREDFALAQRIIKFDAESSHLSNDYLKHLMRSDSFQQSLAMFASGSTALGIKAERFVYLRVLLPPLEEQAAIVKHIENVVRELEAIEERALQQTTLLQERRTALISAAVTGKIDVRHWRLPDSAARDTGIPAGAPR